jgi:hypothetical protein
LPQRDQACDPVKTQRACDIGSSSLRAAFAEPRIGDEILVVAARSRQGQAERTGHRAFGPAGVWRAVLASIAQHDRERSIRATSIGKYRGCDKQQPADRCRHQIEGIVEARCRPAKAPIVWIAMADHAVERVCHLIGEETGQAEQQVPESRRDDAVAEILRQALDCGARYAMDVKAHRIAPDDMFYRSAAGRQAAAIERRCDSGDMLVEAALGDQDPDQQALDDRTQRMPATGQLDREPYRPCRANQRGDRDDTPVAARGFATDFAIELTVEECDGATGERDGMGNAAKDRRRVAEQRVDGEAADQQQQGVDERRHSVVNVRRGQGANYK